MYVWCLFPKMDNRYILIAVSLLTSVSSSYGSQVITTSFGKTATLPCQIANQGSDLQSLYWGKDGTTIYSRTSKGEDVSGKYSVTDTWSLVIHDVMESDAGNYSCIVNIRKSTSKESDIMQLYAIDVSVSHCKDTGQEMDGCSCNINGSNITSLQCSASGFPQPPMVTWEEDRIIYQLSSVDLTRFSENITLTCKARDENLKGVVANKTVCVYYAREVTSTGGSPVETTTASENDQARVAAIVLAIVLILVLLVWPIRCLAAVYIRKKGIAFQIPTSIMCTSMPKRLEEQDEPPLRGKDIDVNDAGCGDVLKDNWKNSKESSLGDLPTSQPGITSIEGENGDVDFSPKDCDQTVVGDEQQLSLVGLVLLDDLRSAPEETKESIKAAVVALVVEPYKIHQSHVDPNVTIHSVLIDMNETLQRSVKTGDLGNPDAAFDLDRILDERDRDECEILITKPDFQEVTDESAYQGNRVIHQSLSMPANMTSSMTSSMVPWNHLPSVIRRELQSSERTATCNNANSRIILDYIREHSGLRGNSCMNCRTAMLTYLSMPANMTSSMTSSMVVFNPLSSVLRGELQSSERAAIYNNAIFQILNCLETGHSSIRGNICLNCSTAMLLSSVSDPVVQTRQEEDEIPDTSSTAKLLEDKCRDSEESNNDHL